MQGTICQVEVLVREVAAHFLVMGIWDRPAVVSLLADLHMHMEAGAVRDLSLMGQEVRTTIPNYM